MVKQMFPNLFSPIKFENVKIRNRIVHSPHGTESEDTNNFIPDRSISYHVARAKGGLGLILLGDTNVEGESASVSIEYPKYIPRLRELTDEVHFWGAKIFAHIHHSTSDPIYQVWIAESGGTFDAIATVSGESPEPGIKARALTIEEIEGIQDSYANGARWAKMAGFDGVSINGAYGFLPAQFLASKANKRTDKYGGDVNGRALFLIETITKIRSKTDPAFPVVLKISADELREDGLTLEDSIAVVPILEEAGLSGLFVVGGTQTKVDLQYAIPPMGTAPFGPFVSSAEAIKKVVKIPVIVGTRINDPEFAENIIKDGKADLVALSRGSLADQEWAIKAQKGRVEDIRKCIYCNRCLGNFWPFYIHHIQCAINPSAFIERDFIRPAMKRKKVLIAGAGPAGMEAARVATLRGHDVTLHEKSGQLGGQLLLAAKAPFKDEIANFTEYLTTQVKKLGIKVKLNTEVTPSVVKRLKPDIVIVATGATPYIPQISGLDRNTVVNAWDVIDGKATTGENVAVAGGGLVGCEVAEKLALENKHVTIVEMLDDIACDVEWTHKMHLLERFQKYNIDVVTGVKVVGITKKGVQVTDNDDTSRVLPADTVVIALGSQANNALAKALEDKIDEVYTIGDCRNPSRILEAVHDGAYIAREI